MNLFVEKALLSDGWAHNVRITIDEGIITGINHSPKQAHDTEMPIVIPGMTNVHSHAFQRAFAGLTELKTSNQDNFWSWREAMYSLLSHLGPDEIEIITQQLYVEMLKAGYTHVGEFHYIHNDKDGKPYRDHTIMSSSIIDVAIDIGIRITHLPVFYAHSGFGGKSPTEGQKRFLHTPQSFLSLYTELDSYYANHPSVKIGIAPHSLRASTPDELTELFENVASTTRIHIHIAEQLAEVEDCCAWSGQRPVDWLYDHFDIDSRWCLVHATHVTESELKRIADSKTSVGLCPTTEANLGDGIFPTAEYLARGGKICIGSDSHVSISPIEELRFLEYEQRLIHRKRGILSSPGKSVGQSLWMETATNGSNALGTAGGSISIGRCADLIALNPNCPSLITKDDRTRMDGVVFDGNINPVTDVMVNGQWVIKDCHHPAENEIFNAFRALCRKLNTT